MSNYKHFLQLCSQYEIKATLKPSEDDAEVVILRLYHEEYGYSRKLQLKLESRTDYLLKKSVGFVQEFITEILEANR